VSPADRALFYEPLRHAAAHLPAGLVRLAPPATEAAIERAAGRLGRPLPHAYAELLRSFDGADLFHEAIVVCGVDRGAFRSVVDVNLDARALLRDGHELVIAETPGGDLTLVDGEGKLWRTSADGEERWLAGSSLPRWIDATLAREQILYDDEGEFLLEAFEPDGEELTPTYALRQAERALRKDPGAAVLHHDLGVAQRRLGRLERARPAFAAAAELDPSNPWPWFDLGRAALDLEVPAEAAEAFQRAADAAAPADRPRLLAWAARGHAAAGDDTAAARARAEAVGADPGLPQALARAAQEAAAAGDEHAGREAEALVAEFSPPSPVRLRLPVVKAEPPPRARSAPRPPTPRRPPPAKRPPRRRGKRK
jgi:hypothetical protein